MNSMTYKSLNISAYKIATQNSVAQSLHKISSEITLLAAALAACFSNQNSSACPKKANPRTTYLKAGQRCSFALPVPRCIRGQYGCVES